MIRENSVQRYRKQFAALAVLCGAAAAPANAGIFEAASLGFDYADFGKHAPKSDGAAFLSTRLSYALPGGIRPAFGVGGFSVGKFYGYGGFERPFNYRNFTLTPGLSVGYYDGWSSKADLGYRLEFRENVSLTYRLTEQLSAGVQAAHMSNANIGDRNPGVNLFGVIFRREFQP